MLIYASFHNKYQRPYVVCEDCIAREAALGIPHFPTSWTVREGAVCQYYCNPVNDEDGDDSPMRSQEDAWEEAFEERNGYMLD